MSTHKHRIGIVGLHAGRSWAAVAHLPALRALADTFEVVGVANRDRASGEAAAAACGIPRAFDDVAALVASPDIDIVVVTVKVPHHLELVTAALEAGKHVYCEWPLGNGLAEAETLAALVRDKGLLGVVGTQARVAPEVLYLRRLLAEGHVGDVLSSTVTAWGAGWGAAIASAETQGYLLDRANGATLLTIPFAHTLAALRDVLGDVSELSAVLANRRRQVRVAGSDALLPMDAHDQVLVSGVLDSGAPLSIHYRGGLPRSGPGLVWEINGTEGDLRLSGQNGHAQLAALSLEGGRGEAPLAPLTLPAETLEGLPAELPHGNVARLYARLASDLAHGTRSAPDFADAVELHRLIAAIETAAERGVRVAPDAPNRRLPPVQPPHRQA